MFLLLQRVTEVTNTVKLTDRMWARLLASTNQPSFLTGEGALQHVIDMDTQEKIDHMKISSI